MNCDTCKNYEAKAERVELGGDAWWENRHINFRDRFFFDGRLLDWIQYNLRAGSLPQEDVATAVLAYASASEKGLIKNQDPELKKWLTGKPRWATRSSEVCAQGYVWR